MNATLLIAAGVPAYLLAGLGFGLRLFYPSYAERLARTRLLWLSAIAVVCHALLVYYGLHTSSGINLSLFNAASLVTWMVTTLLLISALSKPVENLAIVVFPLAALAILLDWRFPAQRLLLNETSWELRLHVISSMLAYAMLTLATAQALLLALQDNQLRRHHPGGFVRTLPPLQTMESLLFELIAVGFVLLSVSLVSGFIYLEDMFGQHVAHKTVLSIAAWICFAILLWGRYRFGWRGRTALRWTLGGFVVLLVAYFGSKAILELVLSR